MAQVRGTAKWEASKPEPFAQMSDAAHDMLNLLLLKLQTMDVMPENDGQYSRLIIPLDAGDESWWRISAHG